MEVSPEHLCQGEALLPTHVDGKRASEARPRPTWPVSKRVNSSKADADDAMLIEPVELKAA
jgi:hypothetical protein